MFLPNTFIGYLLDWKKFQSLGKINFWVTPDSFSTGASLISDEICPCAIHGKTSQGEKQSLDVALSKLKRHYTLEDADGGSEDDGDCGGINDDLTIRWGGMGMMMVGVLLW